MAIWYVDYESGNDANNGITFSTRKQTLSSILALPALTAGDFVRVKKSPEPTLLGNCTWVPLSSNSIVLPPSATRDLYLDGAWVAGTASVTTGTGTARKQGANAAAITIAAAYTSGKIAYYPLSAVGASPVDLSNFSKICFWFYTNAAANSNALSGLNLTLCSDALGNVPVYTLTFPTQPSQLQWTAITLDNVTNFTTATAIQSIALNSTIDVQNTLNIDNVIASTAVTFETGIGTCSATDYDWNNLQPFYGIGSIQNNIVRLDYGPSSNLNLNGSTYGFHGSQTQVLSTYLLKPTKLNIPASWTSTGNNFNTLPVKANTANQRITVTGGWDDVDMSSQTGITWLNSSGMVSAGRFIGAINNTNYWSFENFGTAFAQRFFYTTTNSITMSGVNFKKIYSYNNGGIWMTASAGTTVNDVYIEKFCTTNNGTGPGSVDSSLIIAGVTSNNACSAIDVFTSNVSGPSIWFGVSDNGRSCFMQNISCLNSIYTNSASVPAPVTVLGTGYVINNLVVRNHSGLAGVWYQRTGNFTTTNMFIDNCSQYGMVISNGASTSILKYPCNNVFYNTTISNCGTTVGAQAYAGIASTADNTYYYNTLIQNCSGGSTGGGAYISDVNGTTYFYNLTTIGNRGVGLSRAFSVSRVGSVPGSYYFKDWVYNETTPFALTTGSDATIISVNDDGSPYTVITNDGGTKAQNNAVVRSGGSSTSWKMSLLSTNRNSSSPLTHIMGNVFVKQNTTYTASVYVYRTAADVESKFLIQPYQLAGMTTIISANSTAASLSAWEQLSIVFTPQETGFVNFEIDAWLNTSSLTQAVYWTDFSITPNTTDNINAGNYGALTLNSGVYIGSSSIGGSGGGETTSLFC